MQRWNGKLFVMILPSYGETIGLGPSRARYRAVAAATRDLGMDTIDGVQIFRAARDPLGLYALRIDNHPNERGHALLAEAILAKLDQVQP